MAWSQDELNEIQTYMQLYDKMVISKKTLLEKVSQNLKKPRKGGQPLISSSDR